MPTPYDLLSQKLDTPTDPDDQLRLMLGQDQGANLQGGPDDTPDAQTPPSQGGVGLPPGMQRTGAATLSWSPQPMAPSPNVPGPLAALAPKPGKPKIALKRGPAPPPTKPRVKLKIKPKQKPHITLKSGGLNAVL